jgi:hypothetical protein
MALCSQSTCCAVGSGLTLAGWQWCVGVHKSASHACGAGGVVVLAVADSRVLMSRLAVEKVVCVDPIAAVWSLVWSVKLAL